MKNKIKYIIIPIVMIVIFIVEFVTIYNLTKNKELAIISPNNSIDFKEYLINNDMPKQNDYSIKFIIKDTEKEKNSRYIIHYVEEGNYLTKSVNENKYLNEYFHIKFDNTKIDLKKVCNLIILISFVILFTSTLYVLIGKYEKINKKLKNVIFIIFSIIAYCIAFIMIPMISANYGEKNYLYMIIAILFFCNFIWGYKRKTLFTFSLIEIIPFYIGTLFNYSNTYLGNARLDIFNNIFSIRNISDTISFFTTLFAYVFIGFIFGILGRLYKNKKIDNKINIITLILFIIAFFILVAIKMFVSNTLSIIANFAIEKIIPALIVTIILIIIKLLYNIINKIRGKNE
ncbi:MAG: hypothetical protein GX682_04085 [Clostridiaceae bacterium]|nr:hypothetical protein [Clostridiaceae bacterium]